MGPDFTNAKINDVNVPDTIPYVEYGTNFGLSVGNMVDINQNDFLEFIEIDDKTKVVGFYLETVGDLESGRKFFEKLRNMTNKKPVVILKGGKSQVGKQACISHTGSIAGSNQIYEGVFKQTNVISVKSSLEFYDISYLLSILHPDKLIKGKNICLIVPGGGNSVEMADLLSGIGFNFPEISNSTQKKLEKLLFDVNTSFKNPVDVGTYGILPEMLLNTIKLILKEDKIDIIIAILQLSRILGLQFGHDKFTGMFARSLGRLSRKTDKTFFIIPMIDDDNNKTVRENNQLKKYLNKYRIPHFPSIDRLVKSLEYYQKYYKL